MTRIQVVRAVLGTLLTVLATYGVTRASATNVGLHDAGSAMLRLSWSARPERIEVCRRLSEEELAQRAEHMRQRLECTGRFATYRLQVEADGRLLGDTVVRGAGLRNDRPIYLLKDFAIAPGARRIRVLFQRRESVDSSGAESRERERREERDDDEEHERGKRDDTGTFAGRAQREVVERSRRARAAIPARLELDTVLTFAPGDARVVTFDVVRRVLTPLGR